jgi:YD repeat-containing protein
MTPLCHQTKITLPSRGSATTTFTYDYRGWRTSVTDPNGKKTIHASDDADRLTSATDPNNHVTTYTYDTENNLLSVEDANNTTDSRANVRGQVVILLLLAFRDVVATLLISKSLAVQVVALNRVR